MSLEDVLLFLSQSLTLVLPILFAGVTLIVVLQRQYFAWLDLPLDCGLRVQGKRIFGDNKTWRGVIIYFLVTTIVCGALWGLTRTGFAEFVHPVFSLNPAMVGLVIAASYVLGELVNSFIKRRLNISPGHSSNSGLQRVFDNSDGIVFVAAVLFFVLAVPASSIIVAACAGALLHKSTDVVMVRLGLK